MPGVPVLVQSGGKPIIEFFGGNFSDLICRCCRSSLLIKNYSPRSVYGIGLKCEVCGCIEEIGPLPPGELLPENAIKVDERESLIVDKTIKLHITNVITCAEQVELARKVSFPKPASTKKGTNVSVELLDGIIEQMNFHTGGGFNKPVSITKRAFERGDRSIKSNLLAWSIEIVRDYLVSNIVLDKKSFAIALTVITNHRELMERWSDHFLIKTIASDFCVHYFHTFLQMIVATWFNDHDNGVSINATSKQSKIRSPDLRLRLSSAHDFYLEVKVPSSMDWNSRNLRPVQVKKAVEKCLKNSRGQISKDRPGILVIGSGCLDKNIHKLLLSEVEKVLNRKGKSYTAVAAVTIVCVSSIKSKLLAPYKIDFQSEFYLSTKINAHYFDKNPVKLK